MPASPVRSRNPRGEGGRLREQLVQAAVEVLDEVGDASRVSVRAIARRAGVSPTALYLHFADRDALVSAAVDAGFAAFNATLMGAARTESDPFASLEVTSLAYLSFAEQQPALYAVLFSTRRPRDTASRAFAAVDRGEGFAGLVGLLRGCDPALDAAEARELAITIWSSLHGFAVLSTSRAGADWPPVQDFVRRLLAAHIPR